MMGISAENLNNRLSYPKLDVNLIKQKDNTGITKEELRKILECERFLPVSSLPDHPYAGDIYKMNDKYYINIRPDCDIIRDAKKDNEILDKKMELEHKLALWDNKYDNLVNMRMAGEIEKDKYDSKREELKKEQDSILDQLKNIGDLTDISDKDYKDKLEVLKCGLENDFNFSTKQIPEEIIDAFVDEIVVCDDCFIWKLNFFPDYGLVMGVDGTKKNPSVSLLESTSKNSEQHRLLLQQNRRKFY